MEKDEKKSNITSDKIGKRWREFVDKAQEYEIIETEKDGYEEVIPATPFGILFQEYEKARKLKQRVLKRYKNKTLDDVFEGKKLKTTKGTCYHIENQEKIDLKIIMPELAKRKILSNLRLIYGVGEVTERILKEGGCKTIEDLKGHPRFGFEANNFLKIFNRCDTQEILKWIGHWFSTSHPLMLYSSGLHDKKDFIFLDIETLGLFNRPIILLGVAQISGNNIIINQYVLRNIEDEPAALNGFLSHINKNSVFFTFNGRTFDVPYIKERLAFYRLKGDLDKPNYDILYFSRRAWGGKLPDCKLTTIERYLLGIERKDDVPSALVPEFYETYMRTKNIGPLIPIIEHNRQDLVTLAKIFSNLVEHIEGYNVEWKLQNSDEDFQRIFTDLDLIVNKYCTNCNLYNLYSSKVYTTYHGIVCMVKCPVDYKIQNKLKERLNSMSLPNSDLIGYKKRYFQKYIQTKLSTLSCPNCQDHSITFVISRKVYKCTSCGWSENQFKAYLNNYPFEEKIKNQYVKPIFLGYEADCKSRLQSLQMREKNLQEMLKRGKGSLELFLRSSKGYLLKQFGKMHVIYEIIDNEDFDRYLSSGYQHYNMVNKLIE